MSTRRPTSCTGSSTRRCSSCRSPTAGEAVDGSRTGSCRCCTASRSSLSVTRPR
jgi:hypothetical protein